MRLPFRRVPRGALVFIVLALACTAVLAPRAHASTTTLTVDSDGNDCWLNESDPSNWYGCADGTMYLGNGRTGLLYYPISSIPPA